MQLGRAFSYIFEDEEWLTKTLINGLLNMIPIINIASMGWSMQLITNVIRDDERPLPGWDDFGRKFEIGLSLFIASIVYSLPIIVLSCCMSMAAGVLSDGGDSLSILAGLIIMVLSLATLVMSIIAYAAMFIGIVEFTYEENLAVFWRFGYNIREAFSNIGTLITLFIFMFIAGLVIGLFAWIPCLGWIAAAMIAPPLMGHLAGQAGQKLIDNRSPAKRMA